MQVSRIAANGEFMANDERPVLIYTTFPSLADAKRVGEALVEAALARRPRYADAPAHDGS